MSGLERGMKGTATEQSLYGTFVPTLRNLTPSQADLQLTNKLKEAGKFLDLPVLDHVILTQDSYYSFADEGLL